MTDLESIKKALEGVTPDRLRYEADAMFAAVQGEKYGDTFHAYNWADKPHRVLYDAINLMREAASTLESLQRENERLQSEIDRKSSMPGDHRYWEGRYRHEAEENEKLREALQNVMGCFDTPLSRRRFPPDAFMTEAIGIARTALASTGGEHNAE